MFGVPTAGIRCLNSQVIASEGNHLHKPWIRTIEVDGGLRGYAHWSYFLSILARHQVRGIHAHIRHEAEGRLVPDIIIVSQLEPSCPLQRRL